MKIPETGCLLRIFIGEGDRWQGKSAYEAIVLKAREAGLAGASVFKGAMGYGANSHLHTFKVLRLSEDLPILIEIVDSKEKIEAFIPQIDEIVKEGLITMEDVRVIKYRASESPQ